MDTLKSWMFKAENRRVIPTEELKIVSGELKWHVIGIKGGTMFTITYSVLWNVTTYISMCLYVKFQYFLNHFYLFPCRW